MSDWIRELAAHHKRTRERYPKDDLLVAFDIGGTILDMRHMVCWVLLDFDRNHDSDYFYGLQPEDLTTYEHQVGAFLRQRGLYHCERERILEWYYEHRSSPEAILASHSPHQGVMDVIRWLQSQPRTHVGLNTGLPESMRQETLRSLNALGQEYGVVFSNDLLVMIPPGWDLGAPCAKAEG
jgi:hypothetical protein